MPSPIRHTHTCLFVYIYIHIYRYVCICCIYISHSYYLLLFISSFIYFFLFLAKYRVLIGFMRGAINSLKGFFFNVGKDVEKTFNGVKTSNLLQNSLVTGNTLFQQLTTLKSCIRFDRFWFEQDYWLLIKTAYRILRNYQIFWFFATALYLCLLYFFSYCCWIFLVL